MAKLTTQYLCQSCGCKHNKWVGKCEGCGEWNTLSEEVVTKSPVKKLSAASDCLVSIDNPLIINYTRHLSEIGEFDRVCGGGLVPGSVILVGGDPGIGKSTLLLQLVSKLSQKISCAYISGEESTEQIQMRGQRLEIKAENNNLKVGAASNLEEILQALGGIKNLGLAIIDSIQTVASSYLDAASGTVSQVRFCAQSLIEFAKKNNTIIILVGHVTKDGSLAGPRVLEHMVDTVLYFEGDKSYNFRLLRTIKNRFGATYEIGVFAMGELGLKEIENPSQLFLPPHAQNVAGVAIFAGMEGTRPILCEIQALIAPAYYGTPRRTSVGWDNNRLAMILAVLESRCGLNFGNKDVYLNIAGGLKINEPAADLAIASALISALQNRPNLKNSVYFGEISLSGEVRPVSQHLLRLKEASKLGFTNAICAKVPQDKHHKNDQQLDANSFLAKQKDFMVQEVILLAEIKQMLLNN